ncbi:MAG: tetratricopeptide repeat protein [Magnetococcales bacterium]|nr:tetratricopeptide repeat protein [Magnetococcales bacterium]
MANKKPYVFFQSALLYHQNGQLSHAVDNYRRALKKNSRFVPAWTNMAIALKQLQRLSDAEKACRNALHLDPHHADAWNNLGIILSGKFDFIGAIDAYRHCVEESPDHYLAWTNLGIALVRTEKVGEAITAFSRALLLEPNYTEALVHLIHQKQQVCDWQGLDPLVARLIRHMQHDLGEINPFAFLFLCHDPRQMRLCAEHFAKRVQDQAQRLPVITPNPEMVPTDGRLRIGYLSGDFHQHATASLAAELFINHDRKSFHIFAYSYGPDDGSSARQELIKSFETFRDVFHESDEQIARKIVSDGIHILIDLKGYTRGARPVIMAMRPAPIQVAYLGYPGTMGGKFMDYIISDEVVLPMKQRQQYSEFPVYLPGSYQVNDSRRKVVDTTECRQHHGLPERGIVFCCFNQTVKITPSIFSLWLGLLQEVSGSCLWLLAFNAEASRHMRAFAAQCGISPDRLVFAPVLPHPQHLARYRLADLFLDTLPCNAHTTASDALWLGCPLITCPGETFAGRVAASLLSALGFPELIASDITQYRHLALDLARDEEKRMALHQRLRQAVASSPLFSGEAFARKLETALVMLWKRHLAGDPPSVLNVRLG